MAIARRNRYFVIPAYEPGSRPFFVFMIKKGMESRVIRQLADRDDKVGGSFA